MGKTGWLTERDHSYGLGDAGVDGEKPWRESAAEIGGDTESLSDDSEEDDEHADESQCRGFRKLRLCSACQFENS